ncbi:MAG: hypothetical protein Q8N70_03780, partial [Deltaproteobacteria bacterium]|nr:hypothetical protein [Deltaproteobacteria bacterium]
RRSRFWKNFAIAVWRLRQILCAGGRFTEVDRILAAKKRIWGQACYIAISFNIIHSKKVGK